MQDKVSNISQVGGIEISIIDNGPAKGSRIAWINTGSGLRYKVAIDKAADIVDAFYNKYSLAWISKAGLRAPRPDANAGLEWLESFAGGLVTTCGLTHIGPPETQGNQKRGLHGRISNIPATIESIIQPDLTEGNMDMSITATVLQSSVFGPHLKIKRKISSTLGEPVIQIDDEITNIGNTDSAHMLLYHCNLGWPLIDDDVDIVYKGKCRSRGMDFDNEIFNDSHDYKKCQQPLKSHCGFGESCGFVDVEPDSNGNCNIGVINNKIGVALAIEYPKLQLPAMTNWQHWAPGEYVCALEPGTNHPIGQSNADKQGCLIALKPGEKRTYCLKFSVLEDKNKIEEFSNCRD